MGKNTHTVYRDNDTGKLIPKREAEKLPSKEYTKEQMPNPGRGDTGRGGKK